MMRPLASNGTKTRETPMGMGAENTSSPAWALNSAASIVLGGFPPSQLHLFPVENQYVVIQEASYRWPTASFAGFI